MGNFKRQVAKFLFAKEVADTKTTFTVENEDSQYSSVHAITPTGQDVGRVFICGTLTQVEDIGDNDPYFKARLVDPTGAISVYAGNYQPDAAKVLGEIEIPVHVAVVGKISLFTTEDGTKISSIRAEDVAEVDEDVIRTWTFMAARNLIEHIEDEELTDMKKTALEEYGDVTDDFKKMAVNALKSLLSITNE
jgi:RPA family protein